MRSREDEREKFVHNDNPVVKLFFLLFDSLSPSRYVPSRDNREAENGNFDIKYLHNVSREKLSDHKLMERRVAHCNISQPERFSLINRRREGKAFSAV